MTPLQEDIACYLFAGIFSLLLIAYAANDIYNVTLYNWLIDIAFYTTIVSVIGIFIWIACTEDYVEK